MAKKKEKGKKKKDSAGPRDAVRGAVESTFQKAAGGASKAQELLDDVAATLKSLREANLVETLESVRDEVQTLAKRVAALELRQAEPPKPPARPAVRRASTSTARKPAARKPAAAKTTTARKASSSGTTAARKPASSGTTAAAKTTTARKASSSGTTAARKPAAAKTTAARKPATSRSSSTTAKPATARKPAARKPAASRTTKPSS